MPAHVSRSRGSGTSSRAEVEGKGEGEGDEGGKGETWMEISYMCASGVCVCVCVRARVGWDEESHSGPSVAVSGRQWQCSNPGLEVMDQLTRDRLADWTRDELTDSERFSKFGFGGEPFTTST